MSNPEEGPGPGTRTPEETHDDARDEVGSDAGVVDLEDTGLDGPPITSTRVAEEDPIRDQLARQLNAGSSFAAAAVAQYWPLLMLWALLRRWMRDR